MMMMIMIMMIIIIIIIIIITIIIFIVFCNCLPFDHFCFVMPQWVMQDHLYQWIVIILHFYWEQMYK